MIIPVRNIAGRGIVTDVDAYDLALDSLTMSVNVFMELLKLLRHPRVNVEERSQPTRSDLQAVSALADDDAINIPAGMQDTQTERDEALRSYSIRLDPVAGELVALAGHALVDEIEVARSTLALSPKIVLAGCLMNSTLEAVGASQVLVSNPAGTWWKYQQEASMGFYSGGKRLLAFSPKADVQSQT